jgi:hypothetical protein
MELYFNPYPGAAESEEEGINLAVAAADALSRLQNEYNSELYPKTPDTTVDLKPSKFILVRNLGLVLSIGNIIYKTGNEKREKLRKLLSFFNNGKIIDENELIHVDDWILSILGTPAPVLELAAKNKAIALTIPTEKEWRVDILNFTGRQEKLHNLWGQEDISAIIKHCLEANKDIPDRFKIQFNADFCSGALNSAPDSALWEKLGFFKTMENAKKVNYRPCVRFIKSAQVDKTKHGSLLELRCMGSGHRIFFVYRENCSPEILIGGFYQKNESQSESEAIKMAKKRIDEY